jgi:hypothetical protein
VSDAPKLIGGPYHSPEIDIGEWATCAIRGRQQIRDYTRALIPQPRLVGRGRGIIICGDLERALRIESASAIAHYWGVDPHAVSRWRKALGIEAYEVAGTKALLGQSAAKVAPETRSRVAREAVAALNADPDAKQRRAASHSATMKGRAPSGKTLIASGRAIRLKWREMSAEQRTAESARIRGGYLAKPADYRRATWLKVARSREDSRYESRLSRFIMAMREKGMAISELANWLDLSRAEVSRRVRTLAEQYPVLADVLLTGAQQRAAQRTVAAKDDGLPETPQLPVTLHHAPRRATGACWSDDGRYLGDVGREKHNIAAARLKDARYIRVADGIIADLWHQRGAWPGYRTYQESK